MVGQRYFLAPVPETIPTCPPGRITSCLSALDNQLVQDGGRFRRADMIHLGNDVQHGTGDRTEIDSFAAYHQAILAQKVLLIAGLDVCPERLAGKRDVIV